MHLRRVDAKSDAVPGLDIGPFRTVGRLDLGLDDLMIVSRQHVELQPKAARNEVVVRALHHNAIKVLRAGDSAGTILSKGGSDRQSATLKPGDLLEIGDVRGLHPAAASGERHVVTYRLCVGKYLPEEAEETRRRPTRGPALQPARSSRAVAMPPPPPPPSPPLRKLSVQVERSGRRGSGRRAMEVRTRTAAATRQRARRVVLRPPTAVRPPTAGCRRRTTACRRRRRHLRAPR